jgi:hypothetical protein
MENGEWRMENGEWRMENEEWRMENGESSLTPVYKCSDFYAKYTLAARFSGFGSEFFCHVQCAPKQNPRFCVSDENVTILLSVVYRVCSYERKGLY